MKDSVEVARALIGKLLVRSAGETSLVARIVETEAYRQDDPASHSFRGLTPRSAPMFEEGGIAYVYFIYGMYNCFNVVTDRGGVGSAVLIRAVEPVQGIHAMWHNRFPEIIMPDLPNFYEASSHSRSVTRLIKTLTNGPGKLARSMAITIEKDNGKDLTQSELTIRDDCYCPSPIESDVRIGISAATTMEWRFFLKDNPFVSRTKRSTTG